MKTSGQTTRLAITPDIVVHQPHFTNLAQFLSVVRDSTITDSQSRQLAQLVTNLHSYVTTFPSTPGQSGSLTHLLTTITASHDLQTRYLQSQIASLTEKCTRPESQLSPDHQDDTDMIQYLSPELHLRPDIQTSKSLVHEIQVKVASSEPWSLPLLRNFLNKSRLLLLPMPSAFTTTEPKCVTCTLNWTPFPRCRAFPERH
jgi:hypothetical protein